MRVASSLLVCVWSFSLCCLGCACMKPKMPDPAHVAAVLADEYESVFFAEAEHVGGRGAYRALSEQDASVLRIPFADLLHALESLRAGTSVALMRGAKAVLVGAGDFAPPGGPPPRLGGTRSRYCYVVVLGAKSDVQLARLVTGPSAGEVAGQPVWQWYAAIQEGEAQPSRIYAVHLASQYLLVGNSLPDLGSVGERLLARDAARMDPLPTGVVLDPRAIWGFRVSPRNATGARGSELPVGTAALLLVVTPANGSGVLRAEARDDGTVPPPMSAHVPALRKVGPKTWETTLSFKGDESTLEATLSALGYLGFGVYL